MPALVAMRLNKQMQEKYEALKRAGKPAKVALTAIIRKVIELANALIRDDRKWSQGLIKTDTLNAQKLKPSDRKGQSLHKKVNLCDVLL